MIKCAVQNSIKCMMNGLDSTVLIKTIPARLFVSVSIAVRAKLTYGWAWVDYLTMGPF